MEKETMTHAQFLKSALKGYLYATMLLLFLTGNIRDWARVLVILSAVLTRDLWQ